MVKSAPGRGNQCAGVARVLRRLKCVIWWSAPSIMWNVIDRSTRSRARRKRGSALRRLPPTSWREMKRRVDARIPTRLRRDARKGAGCERPSEHRHPGPSRGRRVGPSRVLPAPAAPEWTCERPSLTGCHAAAREDPPHYDRACGWRFPRVTRRKSARAAGSRSNTALRSPTRPGDHRFRLPRHCCKVILANTGPEPFTIQTRRPDRADGHRAGHASRRSTPYADLDETERGDGRIRQLGHRVSRGAPCNRG